jgi:pre-rRNA-processing protein TSR3
LAEIPFHALGKPQNQRKLPLLIAANSVNYGKAYKMNTVEAIAASLYIAGFTSDAVTLLYPFSFGAEFMKLNAAALSEYVACTCQDEILAVMNNFLVEAEQNKIEKKGRKEQSIKKNCYLDEADLPPLVDSEEEQELPAREEEGEAEEDS